MGNLRIQHMKVGDRYVTSSRIVTRTEIENFCAATGMKLPVFASDEWVKASPEHQALGVKGSVAPGQFAMAIFLGNLITDGLLDDVIVQLGTDKVKYLAPVYPYDTLRTEIEITGNRVSKSGTQVIVDYKWAVKNQNDVIVEQGENTCMFKHI
jgi:acyl dehydratase